MKNFIARNRKTVFFHALYSSAIVSVCFYAFVRILFFEFPMTWFEEAVFFLKIVLTGSIFIATCRSGVAGIYVFVTLKKRLGVKLPRFKLPNTLFLKKNREYVQYPACST